jgi:nitrogenase molybdenum-iron protein beta chain
MAGNAGAGYLGGGYCGGTAWSSSNVGETEIVFGGVERLKEQIKTTLEVVDGDLYVVLSGCMVELIGDDLEAAVADLAGEFKGPKILAVSTPGFADRRGYDLVMSELFRSFCLKGLEKKAEVINFLGLVPGQDVFYKGNLAELKRMAATIGLKANTFFGDFEDLGVLERASEASLNVVLSDYHGQLAAQTFSEVHGTPYLTLPLPVGAIQSREFLKNLGQAVGLSREVPKRAADLEEDRYYDYLERAADIVNDVDLQRYLIVVADSLYAPAATRFFADELGWIPVLTVVTDDLDDQTRKTVSGRFEGFESQLKPLVKFESSAIKTRAHLNQAWPRVGSQRHQDPLSPAVVVGSVFERELAEGFSYPLLSLSYPVTDQVIFQQARAGYEGGLSLASAALSLVVAGR